MSFEDAEITKLKQIIEAERWRQRWLTDYLINGGTFYDSTLGREVTKDDIRVELL